MTLDLFRGVSQEGATIGKLSVNGLYQCFIGEDVVREIPGQPVHMWKVHGSTAIPAGRYKITLTPSVRFKRILPELHNVPGFVGIRIHPGNGPLDTEGCLLPGVTRSVNGVGRSREAFSALYEKLRKALANDEECWITVHNYRADA